MIFGVKFVLMLTHILLHAFSLKEQGKSCINFFELSWRNCVIPRKGMQPCPEFLSPVLTTCLISKFLSACVT